MSATCAAPRSCLAAGWPAPMPEALRRLGRGLAGAEARHRRPQGGGAAALLRLPARRGAARATILPPRLPRPASERPLPKILDHQAVDALFAEIERRKAEGRAAGAAPRRP